MPSAGAGSVDAYVAGFPADTQRVLNELRAVIREAAPGAEETINYGVPTYVLHGNLVHFAGYRNHIGFYPTPSALKAFAKDLAAFKTAKGSIQFPLEKPLPLPLIRRIAAFRIHELTEKDAKWM